MKIKTLKKAHSKAWTKFPLNDMGEQELARRKLLKAFGVKPKLANVLCYESPTNWQVFIKFQSLPFHAQVELEGDECYDAYFKLADGCYSFTPPWDQY